MLTPSLRIREHLALAPYARAEVQRDKRGLGADPGIAATNNAALAWLVRAQDYSASQDGGVARHYSLKTGWAPSYPETTGYIVPTILTAARKWSDPTLYTRARRMLDWLVSIQFPEGGFQGGMIGQTPFVPVTFNTGQILMGFASGVTEFGDVYRPAMRLAADWLLSIQDSDGAWRKHATPFATFGASPYHTHVAWGLLEAARVDPERGYAEAALRNIHWALTKQQTNGWFADCCLTDHKKPLTHTIGYVLRGLIEAYRFTKDEQFLHAALRTATALLSASTEDGFLPGRLDASWKGAVKWVCLTGSVQIAHCWLSLYQYTGELRFRDAAFAVNRYVRSTVRMDGPLDVRGGVKGSFPISGEYGSFEYLNWAGKFLIDSNLLEQSIRDAETD